MLKLAPCTFLASMGPGRNILCRAVHVERSDETDKNTLHCPFDSQNRSPLPTCIFKLPDYATLCLFTSRPASCQSLPGWGKRQDPHRETWSFLALSVASSNHGEMSCKNQERWAGTLDTIPCTCHIALNQALCLCLRSKLRTLIPAPAPWCSYPLRGEVRAFGQRSGWRIDWRGTMGVKWETMVLQESMLR
jgi:hypothetical protein